MALAVMSAGAAKLLVTRLRPAFEVETGYDLDAVFGAAGTLHDEFVAGHPCDVLILSQALIDGLVGDGKLVQPSVAALGLVRTALAVGADDPAPDVSTPDAVKATLLASRGIYLGDPMKSTGARHFMSVLDRLQIRDQVTPYLHTYDAGTTAMEHLAMSDETGRIGCTQTTEVRDTQGVRLIGSLPAELGLATTYTAAVTSNTAHQNAAQHLVSMLTTESSYGLRRECGFEF
ncbi:MAG: substrate-binding domain-containing protein [Microbacteriaceae bacterium]